MIPERIRWAVELLSIKDGDHVMEIGCGGGVAVELIASKLTRGRILAIDRSTKMIERAAARNGEAIDAGRVELRQEALESVELPSRTFDKIFAVNVNHFWVRDPAKELVKLKKSLRARGSLLLVYESPTPASVKTTGERVVRVLEQNGFAASMSAEQSLVCIQGTPR